MSDLYKYMSETQIEGLNRPTEVATGLPGVAYTDQGFWELERHNFFSARWMACSHACELPNVGDVLPVSIAGFELVLTKDVDGVIRAFHNICAHRGMRVLDVKGHGETAMRCPWHSWTYDLRGRLIATPNLGGVHIGELESFQCSDLGLQEVRCETFLDLIFVNIDGNAESLGDFLEPLKTRLQKYDLALLRPSGQLTNTTFKSNWKLVLEGGLEDYHLPWVHPQLGASAGTFVPEWDESGCYVGFTNCRPVKNRPGGGELPNTVKRLPIFPHLRSDIPYGEMGNEGMIFMLPPTAVVAVMEDHVVLTVLAPQTLSQTEQRRSFLYIGDAAVSDEMQSNRDAVCNSWLEVGQQDAHLAGVLQKQHKLRSDIATPVRFSPHWESAVHHFQKMVIAHLLKRNLASAD